MLTRMYKFYSKKLNRHAHVISNSLEAAKIDLANKHDYLNNFVNLEDDWKYIRYYDIDNDPVSID